MKQSSQDQFGYVRMQVWDDCEICGGSFKKEEIDDHLTYCRVNRSQQQSSKSMEIDQISSQKQTNQKKNPQKIQTVPSQDVEIIQVKKKRNTKKKDQQEIVIQDQQKPNSTKITLKKEVIKKQKPIQKKKQAIGLINLMHEVFSNSESNQEIQQKNNQQMEKKAQSTQVFQQQEQEQQEQILNIQQQQQQQKNNQQNQNIPNLHPLIPITQLYTQSQLSAKQKIWAQIEELKNNLGLSPFEAIQYVREQIALKKEQDYHKFIEIDFKLTQNLDDEHKECTICTECYNPGDKLALLECTHRFHLQCYSEWSKKNSKCPICQH